MIMNVVPSYKPNLQVPVAALARELEAPLENVNAWVVVPREIPVIR
jgi:hypothetical protein